jgi:hypothetical protein
MKKILFNLSLLALAINANAQGLSEVVTQQGGLIINPGPIKVTPHGSPIKAIRGFGNAAENIGTTYYDLQSNASMSRRIINFGNGTVSAIWTISNETAQDTYADRGTGYNSKTSTIPWKAPSTISRFETFRTGFCNLLQVGTGGVGSVAEQVYNHNSAGRSCYGFNNGSVGTSAFSLLATLNTPVISDTILWPKSAAVGNNVYVIGTNSNAADSTTQMYYSRSTNGGTSWAQNSVPLPLLTKNEIWSSSADSYNIDAKDSLVSVVIGGNFSNLYVLQSTNYGATFTKIDTLLYNGVDAGNPVLQTTHLSPTDTVAMGSDGTAGILIDSKGNTHVTFSPFAWEIDSTLQADNLALADPTQALITQYRTFFANTLFHVSTKKGQNNLSVIDSFMDCNGDGTFSIGSTTFNTGATSRSARYGGNGTTNYSQMASIKSSTTNGEDTIFVVYSVMMDADTTPSTSSLGGQNFRDVAVKFSTDAGTTWSNRVNLSNTPQIEEMFPSVAKMVDGDLHLIWQRDGEPGTVLTNGDDKDPSPNTIQYLKVSKKYIYDHAAAGDAMCQNSLLGPDAITELDANGNNKYTITPNPATSMVTINGKMDNNKIVVLNAVGQVVNVNVTVTNNNTAVLNISNLPNGVYNVQIGNAKNFSTTRFVKN